MINKEINIIRYPVLGVLLVLIVISAFPASAGINFNFTNVTPRNYTIPDAVLNTPNFVRLTGGDITVPSIDLSLSIDKTLTSGNRSLVLKAGPFVNKITTLPPQKVYIVSGTTISGGKAAVKYTIDAPSFPNTMVNVSIYKQISGNLPFFSDFSIALLNLADLKDTWNNNTKVMDELLDTVFNDLNNVSKMPIKLGGSGNSESITQNLPAGNYLIMVTNGTDPKKIITWNIIKVMPFNSAITVGDDSGFAPQGLDLDVNISLSGAPPGSYTYITSIINSSDYRINIGKINISWNSSGTLANSATVNGTLLDSATALTDIIPRSNISRTTTGSTSAILKLKTGSLPTGSYFVNTVVFNNTNLSVAFDQTLLTLQPTTTTPILTINGSGYLTDNLTIPTPDANITVNIRNGTRATLNGLPISSTTAFSLPSVNPTLVNAASASNLRFLGKNVTLLPAGAIFTPYILITFNYSQSDVPPGVGEGGIDAYTYNGSTNLWEALVIDSKGTYTGGGKFITVRVTHFSTFALLGTSASAPRGGGGGSGTATGGGGVVTGEPFDNIAKAETQDRDLISNTPITYSFTTPDLGVYQVAVTSTNNESSISLRAELLKGTSKLVTVSPPGTLYKNINMWVGTQRIKEVLVRFKVDNTWISSNNVASGDVILLKWDGSKWVQLETAEKTKDSGYTYYEAKTDTLSIFAISGIKGVEAPTATPGAAITPAGATPTTTATPKTPGFETISALAGMLAIAYLLRRED
ncbi:MAG: PGF-pre-PGF domain-containing protein [Candidatus Methanoperedens sp.]|nr:PGF-pre-PGF domain-containing protein [Candidatus Methanoperedens sp.]MCZ7370635.1 PGF-pre-PGF domain-containing protein [Candidatus Methanoperedens sp.]